MRWCTQPTTWKISITSNHRAATLWKAACTSMQRSSKLPSSSGKSFMRMTMAFASSNSLTDPMIKSMTSWHLWITHKLREEKTKITSLAGAKRHHGKLKRSGSPWMSHAILASSSLSGRLNSESNTTALISRSSADRSMTAQASAWMAESAWTAPANAAKASKATSARSMSTCRTAQTTRSTSSTSSSSS